MLIPLRSRKVGGGSANRALTGSGVSCSQGLVAQVPIGLISGQASAASAGSLGKNRTIALAGSSVTASRGTLTFTTDQEPTWVGLVPTVNFPQGQADTYSLIQHTLNFNPSIHQVDLTTGTLPTGVTLSAGGILTYNGTSPTASASGLSYTIANIATTADADFLVRSTSPGVFRSFGFNSVADLGGAYGANYGTVPGTGTVGLDSTVKASGTSSLRFGLAAGGHSGGGNSSSWFTNFHANLQRYGAGTEFFYQFKVRLSTEAYQDYSHKFFLVGSGDDGTNLFASCTDLEIEMEHYSNSGASVGATNAFPVMYNACPGSCGGVYTFFEPVSGGNFDLQPGGPAPICSYQDGTKTGCFKFAPNEWMVFQVGVTVGPRVTSGGHYWFQGSRIRLWAQSSPGATEQLIIDWVTGSTAGSQIGLCAGHNATGNQAYGKLWLLPYTQNSIGSGARAASVWYDELILSESKIPAALA
jgi:hypothetical protein